MFKKKSVTEQTKDEFVEGIKYETPIDDSNKQQFKKNLDKKIDQKKIDQDDEIEQIVQDAIKESEENDVKVDDECCFKVREKLQDTYEISKELEHKLSNLNKTFLVVFLAGVAFGMSDNKWLPYASMLWEFGKDILVKG